MHAECGGRRKDETWLPLHTAQDSCISDGRKKTQIVYSTCSSNPQTHDFNLPKASVQHHLPCSPSSMWIWADRHFWKKKPGDTHQFLTFICSSHLFLYLKYSVLFCLSEFNLSLPSRPVPFVLFLLYLFLQRQQTYRTNPEWVESTHTCILTAKWPHCDGQHSLMLLPEEHVSCTWHNDSIRHNQPLPMALLQTSSTIDH